ncbi:MAG: MFS transporter [Caldilineaceae bacterium]|nr:MFS transporter [Caldilineaceae bacterium]
MKSQTAALSKAQAATSAEAIAELPPAEKAKSSPLSKAAATRILYSLMVPTMMMPLLSSMSRVALPIVRNDFQIAADMTAWVDAIFTLPFMFLMPVYGRLSDGVGRRRLILAGIVIFAIGTTMTVTAANLAWLMAGRAIQGVGTAGMMPLAMAMISTIFPPTERGKALGTWSSVGPTTAFVGPLIAGFLVDHYGWRAAFAPPLLIAVISLAVVYKNVPAGLSTVQPRFWRTFDWLGVTLLAGATTMLLFFLSSRPITGVEPLQDWRLGLGMVALFLFFYLWERRQRTPFVDLSLFQNRMFTLGSICGAMRMIVMAGQGFLIVLYLVDIHGVSAANLGTITMISAGSMALIVRFGGQVADRWGSRWPTVLGIGGQGTVMVIFAFLPPTTPLWVIALVLAFYGQAAGFVLAALHRAAIGNISNTQMGSATGLYSMIRFAGAMVGTALCGVILQHYLNQGLPVLAAYQRAFVFLACAALVGSSLGFTLREPKKTKTQIAPATS